MARIKKKEPVPSTLFVDTNIIWHRDKTFVVDPKFDNFWEKYSKDFRLELAIPEVVQGEILFQQATSATKLLKNAHLQLDQISQITGKKYTKRITEHKIKEQISKRFDEWLKGTNTKILESPIGKINWGNIIHKSIWSLPPFSFDVKNTDNEKGFRDAIILETVKDFSLNEIRDIRIVFLSNDLLLLDTALAELSSDPRFDSYQTLDDFESYLKLTKEEFENQFIKAIIRRANRKFFKGNDPNCLFYRENIRTKLETDFKKFFENPEVANISLTNLIGFGLGREQFTPDDDGMFWISNAQFQEIMPEKVYRWLSKVTYVRLYKRYTSIRTNDLDKLQLYRVLILLFDIHWEAKVSHDGRFRDLSLVEIKLADSSFKIPTEKQITSYKLKI